MPITMPPFFTFSACWTADELLRGNALAGCVMAEPQTVAGSAKALRVATPA